MRLKKGDTILVIKGKDRGRTGKIERILPRFFQVIVTGVNVLKKHSKATRKNPHGGIVKFFAPIPISNVMLICPRCDKKTRVSYKILKIGKKIRICKKCQESLEHE